MEQELERLEGTVEDIIYLNEDNGYTVFEVSGIYGRHTVSWLTRGNP